MLIAAAALTLSQLPPLHIMFRRARLGCEAYSLLHITHKVGNPNAQWHLIIENKGGRVVRVKGLTLEFRRKGAVPFTLPAQNYLMTPDAKETVMFTPFRLLPREERAHIINFFQLFARDEDKEYRFLESAVRSDILQQKQEPENREKLCEASPTVVAGLLNFFRRKYQWVPGEYSLTLSIHTEPAAAGLKKQYRFTLFESEARELEEYSQGYKYGAGVYWISDAQPGLLVPIYED
ncbi:hypothetical protein [Methylocaldum sp. RMAD-M]|nr:hypothetical protein [Methylocaldum sp. RMAD-M]